MTALQHMINTVATLYFVRLPCPQMDGRGRSPRNPRFVQLLLVLLMACVVFFIQLLMHLRSGASVAETIEEGYRLLVCCCTCFSECVFIYASLWRIPQHLKQLQHGNWSETKCTGGPS